MKKIGLNLTACEEVLKKYNLIGYVELYPCYSDCKNIDALFIDNGCDEYYTLDKKMANDNVHLHFIVIKNNEIRLNTGEFLEVLELKSIISN